ncbi:ABC transporter permease subunit [Pseudoalteromonas sp. McH1-7]|uniref:ABC transporter permease subunit n=1 Tax=Pseudoalteromonas sp. McH1-7 TaxID=2745574 RepID=UPI001590120D|nr:ABC transporter permease subunit [Pseudoalteromonas sp. McH1-7]NUZ09427.1 ABC transporter permease subunit [Pseudoalteromonas sp. McH1-7]
MNIKRIGLIAIFELQRLFATKRGWIAIAAFVLVWYAILRYAIAEAISIVSDPNFKNMIQSFSGVVGMQKIALWPEMELALYLVWSIFLFPMFVIFASADQTVEDRTRGTLRFLTLRTTRAEIVIGRFFGQLFNTLLLITISAVGAWLLMVLRDPTLWLSGLHRATLIVLELTLITAPFIALMSVSNHFANSSKMSMIYAILAYITLATIVAFALEYSAYAEYLFYLFPGYQGAETIAQNINLTRFATPLIHSVVLIAISCELLRRRAL